jgi:hypothetical protein
MTGSKDGKSLWLTGFDGMLAEFCIGTGKIAKNYGMVTGAQVERMVVSCNGGFLITADGKGCVKFWDLGAKKIARNAGAVVDGDLVDLFSLGN